ncbi:MAG: hypothetical protein HQM16_04645 [Deltaproteobacteria bacterium]|nr:hypothetical protein [Deltaproteobacteria bacterium]
MINGILGHGGVMRPLFVDGGSVAEVLEGGAAFRMASVADGVPSAGPCFRGLFAAQPLLSGGSAAIPSGGVKSARSREHCAQLQDHVQTKIHKLRALVAEEQRVLAGHEAAIDSKQEFFEAYQRLISEPASPDRDAALSRLEKKNLGRIMQFYVNKHRQVLKLERRLAMLEAGMSALQDFDPPESRIIRGPADGRLVAMQNDAGWNIPNSLWKVWHGLFSVPSFRLKLAGHATREQYDALNLHHALTFPERYPVHLIKRLGLAPINLARGEEERLLMKILAEEGLRSLFGSASPLMDREGHILPSYRFLQTSQGYLLHVYHSGRQPKPQDRKFVQLFTNAYTALRAAGHTAANEADERMRLDAMLGRVEKIHLGLVTVSAQDPSYATQLEKLSEQLHHEVSLLERASNVYKRTGGDLMETIADIHDALDRLNPKAAAARMVRVLRELKGRPPQILGIETATNDDQILITRRIEEGESVMQGFFDGFRVVCDTLKAAKNNPVFSGKGTVGKQREILTRMLVDPLKKVVDSGQGLLSPFSSYVQKFNERVGEIERGIEAGDLNAVVAAAVKGYVTAKIFQVQRLVEQIKFKVRPDADIRALIAHAESIRRLVRGREVFPKTGVSYHKVNIGYQGVYSGMEKSVDALVKGLRHYQAQPPHRLDRMAVYERMKLFLDEELDFEGVVSSLK